MGSGEGALREKPAPPPLRRQADEARQDGTQDVYSHQFKIEHKKHISS
jgi:hypothetical protein